MATSSETVRDIGFNTQPPEGGWTSILVLCILAYVFQHTAARRRLVNVVISVTQVTYVSTHSRPKAAGNQVLHRHQARQVSTHSRPKAAGSGSTTTRART